LARRTSDGENRLFHGSVGRCLIETMPRAHCTPSSGPCHRGVTVRWAISDSQKIIAPRRNRICPSSPRTAHLHFPFAKT
jgi:hypothetical protein